MPRSMETDREVHKPGCSGYIKGKTEPLVWGPIYEEELKLLCAIAEECKKCTITSTILFEKLVRLSEIQTWPHHVS
jgi:hypothetical protein